MVVRHNISEAISPRGARGDFASRGARRFRPAISPRGARGDFAPRDARRFRLEGREAISPRGARGDFCSLRGARGDFAPRFRREAILPRGARGDVASRGARRRRLEGREATSPRGARGDFCSLRGAQGDFASSGVRRFCLVGREAISPRGARGDAREAILPRGARGARFQEVWPALKKSGGRKSLQGDPYWQAVTTLYLDKDALAPGELIYNPMRRHSLFNVPTAPCRPGSRPQVSPTSFRRVGLSGVRSA